MSIAVHTPSARHTEQSGPLRSKQLSGNHPGLISSVPGDFSEREADRLAHSAMDRPALHPGNGPLQAGPAPSNEESPLADLFSRSGRPLPPEVREDFEARFRHDFSRVRIHPEGLAGRAAGRLGARAFTVGEDVAMAPGQYAPHTPDGRRLLAHELAHVVQGRRDIAAPLIRPRLFVTGGAADIRSFLNLLETDGGFALVRDPKTGQVTGKPLKTPPPSPALADVLRTIMNDPNRDAEISLGGSKAAVSFGAYPTSLPDNPPQGREGLEQNVDIGQILALEKGIPGYGAAILAHEMFENYQFHDPDTLKSLHDRPDRQPSTMDAAFPQAHKAALEKEGAIGEDFGLKGRRKNTYHVFVGKKPRRIRRSIEDHVQYFITFDSPFDRPGPAVSNVRKVGRVHVSTYTLDHYQGRTGDVPEGAKKILDQVASDMLKDLTISAAVEGRMSVFDSRRGDPRDPEIMAFQVSDYLSEKLKDINPDTSADNWQRFRSEGRFVSIDSSSIVITLDRPDM